MTDFLREKTVSEAPATVGPDAFDGLYPMIFKRRSFHTFPGGRSLSVEELAEIEAFTSRIRPLTPGTRVAFNIVPREKTNCKRGQYCVLFYSEKNEYYLYNAGYMMEQLDLWLTARDIGVCWYGFGRTREKLKDGLSFVIMLAIEKAEPGDFRKDYRKSARKPTGEIFEGTDYREVVEVAKYAPSACNTQPWFVRSEPGRLLVSRIRGSRGIIPARLLSFYNKIDIGIFLLFVELGLRHEGRTTEIRLFSDADEGKENRVAEFCVDEPVIDQRLSCL
ncbi:MAG: nitroreductase family protein [Oscillospiraceae bacterium]|nr:nitroreductase family protein [Oscillospiraceae bacterium]